MGGQIFRTSDSELLNLVNVGAAQLPKHRQVKHCYVCFVIHVPRYCGTVCSDVYIFIGL